MDGSPHTAGPLGGTLVTRESSAHLFLGPSAANPPAVDSGAQACLIDSRDQVETFRWTRVLGRCELPAPRYTWPEWGSRSKNKSKLVGNSSTALINTTPKHGSDYTANRCSSPAVTGGLVEEMFWQLD